MRSLICLFACLFAMTTALAQTPRKLSPATSEVKRMAKKLATSFVDTASAQTLDQFANRSIAFAGMVPGLMVKVDGRWMEAGQALLDSGLTIIKQSDNLADARAMRNAVYILMEISAGRTYK